MSMLPWPLLNAPKGLETLKIVGIGKTDEPVFNNREFREWEFFKYPLNRRKSCAPKKVPKTDNVPITTSMGTAPSFNATPKKAIQNGTNGTE